ncbi:MAG: macro domain-containing protein [Lachnospiraceae bacterium]|nr:macro domain-containing protein [Lachnospiraceae bacterium]
MPFQIIRNDITKVKADAIVNTANPCPVYASGTDAAIYEAAGADRLLAERKKIGDIRPGEAAVTPAFDLDAQYIIHTVGPSWIDGYHEERETLHSCYARSLQMAADLNCESIAFPLIATGVYGFPKDEALQIALAEINRFLLSHDMLVILVVFDRKAFELSGKLVGDIKEYIDENEVSEIRLAEFGIFSRYERGRRGDRRASKEEETALRGCNEKSALSQETMSVLPDVSGKSLDEVLGNTGVTFQQRLFQLIDERGLDDVTVYKKANIDRKVFSKIRCKEDYKPKKKTAVAFAIALELDMPTMLDLLSRAEIAFSPSNKFDLIITYFITNKVYDIFEINAALFKYGQSILGE